MKPNDGLKRHRRLSARSMGALPGQLDLFAAPTPQASYEMNRPKEEPAPRADAADAPSCAKDLPSIQPRPIAPRSGAQSARKAQTSVTPTTAKAPCAQGAGSPQAAPRFRSHTEAQGRYFVRTEDVPEYAEAAIAQAQAALAQLPAEKLFFTYADLRRAFGVSRTTILRKLRAGLVPGVAFAGARMVQDGAVRRLTREQVAYVLLAVRAQRV